MDHPSVIDLEGITWVDMDIYHRDDTMRCYRAEHGENRAIAQTDGRWEVRGKRWSNSAIEDDLEQAMMQANAVLKGEPRPPRTRKPHEWERRHMLRNSRLK